MAKIDSAYEYYLTTYGDTLGYRYESHKKSELRNTYNNILKTNKTSPLYKITQTGDLTKFAIDIKEQATQLSNSVARLNTGDDTSKLPQQKIASSSDEASVIARYIGNDSDSTNGFNIGVSQLARPQINIGNYLNPNGRDFEVGEYSFDLDTKQNSYEFMFTVNPGDSNLAVLQKLNRLFNTSDVGVRSEILTNSKGYNALSVSSKNTGLEEGSDYAFSISSNTSWTELNTLGISRMSQAASNSEFTLNGSTHNSMSNTFTINNAFEITLVKTTAEDATIGFKNDNDALADGVENMLNSYNNMLEVGHRYSDAHGNNQLFNDVSAIQRRMSASLSEIGISPNEDGYLSINRKQFAEAIDSEDSAQHITTLNNFKNALSRQAEKASLNPMNYVNKLIVEYKNPNNPQSFPYAPSAYAGMLVDRAL